MVRRWWSSKKKEEQYKSLLTKVESLAQSERLEHDCEVASTICEASELLTFLESKRPVSTLTSFTEHLRGAISKYVDMWGEKFMEEMPQSADTDAMSKLLHAASMAFPLDGRIADYQARMAEIQSVHGVASLLQDVQKVFVEFLKDPMTEEKASQCVESIAKFGTLQLDERTSTAAAQAFPVLMQRFCDATGKDESIGHAKLLLTFMDHAIRVGQQKQWRIVHEHMAALNTLHQLRGLMASEEVDPDALQRCRKLMEDVRVGMSAANENALYEDVDERHLRAFLELRKTSYSSFNEWSQRLHDEKLDKCKAQLDEFRRDLPRSGFGVESADKLDWVLDAPKNSSMDDLHERAATAGFLGVDAAKVEGMIATFLGSLSDYKEVLSMAGKVASDEYMDSSYKLALRCQQTLVEQQLLNWYKKPPASMDDLRIGVQREIKKLRDLKAPEKKKLLPQSMFEWAKAAVTGRKG